MPVVPTKLITIEKVDASHRPPFKKNQTVYYIICDGCRGFPYERPKVDDARWFAQMHNEEVHSSAFRIVDRTRAPS